MGVHAEGVCDIAATSWDDCMALNCGRIPPQPVCPIPEVPNMAQTREATARWSGDLLSGSGAVSAATTGVFSDLPVTWASRTGEPDGLTSPEELLATAHASCFSMAVSNELAKAGTPPESVSTRVAITADKLETGWTVQKSHITVRARVPGATPESFREAAEKARDGCPISKALRGNIELSVDAQLEG